MLLIRWFVAVSFLVCLWLSFGLPAAGMLLAVRAPPALALPDLLPVVHGERRELGASYREKVGGLWHLHLEGDAVARGYAHGALAGDLIAKVEGEMMDTFVKLVPNFLARHALLGLVCWNNRNLAGFFTPDELQEIAADVAGNERFHDPYRAMFPHYTRGLQYHALHDISHYLIDNPLVNAPQIGCTAVAVKGTRSADGHLLVGRLFDFEGGREFDRDKVVVTVKPDHGLAFVSVAWAGITGAVTGLNEAGLWTSINAGASSGQAFVGRPVLMAVREILQNCRTIAEAEAVLRRSRVFISEAILIASGPEHRAVVAEIGPTGLALREMAEDRLVCANHFLAARWADDPVNQRRMREGTSVKRAARAEALLAARPQHTPASLLELLRDRRGVDDADVGFGNRGTINAWIGAHLVIADIDAGVIWVAEPSHGLGRALAFDVHGPLMGEPLPASVDLPLYEQRAQRWVQLRDLARTLIANHHAAEAATLTGELVALNPGNFESHLLAGLASTDAAARRRELETALSLQPAYPRDRQRIEDLLGISAENPVKTAVPAPGGPPP